ncbi:ABC transporter ATP-binding protein [Leptospira gomenensis]|uniref:ABC transporter ATP-binding protein n=1 Tax=Leptospira gomenensis TaxID=2484974 RepID=A0A5F1Y979_9LEPT|nr:ABC transporter ATP-binding protein [Leptospira gomenensis]TGK32657.1 ABC transporter ATP-binding protein [Leptospira gomenensis]TGK36805.1 ABC transporter ATP-binding protein [Leptospira gomenensis]TGK44433.1 ABC transporter ATP-binding protein [Leptospira gomenensis]TGK65320.1 ABC transporter ATP-binding protein [Leptospira gomenensis]
MLQVKNLNKSYSISGKKLDVLKDVSFRIEEGEFIAIIGPSGSGKSTLLAISAGLDRPDEGEVILDGIPLLEKDEDDLAKLRGEKIGFIFQNFQLIKSLNALENVSLPLVLNSDFGSARIKELALTWLEKVSMKERALNFPGQLSGGEEQRIAIARSFIHNPKILFADEPTANLDKKNGEMVMNLLAELNQKTSSTLIVVTHDHSVAGLADRVLEMSDGKIVREIVGKTKSNKKTPVKKKTAKKKR